MINWNTVTIKGPDTLWEVAKQLKRPDTKTAREIVLAERVKWTLELERLLRGG